MRRALFALVSTIVGLVMLLSFKTQSSTVTMPPTAGTSDRSGTGSGTPGTGSGSAGGPNGTATGSKTVTGGAAQTSYGPVQVRITIANGAVTKVTAIEYPENEPRDRQINAYAIPRLNEEAIAAGNADIDIVSGATYTSEGYIDSLQSALDQAGLS